MSALGLGSPDLSLRSPAKFILRWALTANRFVLRATAKPAGVKSEAAAGVSEECTRFFGQAAEGRFAVYLIPSREDVRVRQDTPTLLFTALMDAEMLYVHTSGIFICVGNNEQYRRK